VSALCAGDKCWGSYDVTSVWLVLWQLCISSSVVVKDLRLKDEDKDEDLRIGP